MVGECESGSRQVITERHDVIAMAIDALMDPDEA